MYGICFYLDANLRNSSGGRATYSSLGDSAGRLMGGASILMTRNLEGRRKRSAQKNITLMQVRWQNFGDDLRAERTRRGLTYRQFAQMTGVNFSTLARLESFYTPCNTETFMTLIIEMKKDPLDYICRRAVGFADWIKQTEPAEEAE